MKFHFAEFSHGKTRKIYFTGVFAMCVLRATFIYGNEPESKAESKLKESHEAKTEKAAESQSEKKETKSEEHPAPHAAEHQAAVEKNPKHEESGEDRPT